MEKIKNVVCEICGNRYRKQAGLRQHMESVHTLERRFVCIQCGKGFSAKARLVIHSRIHTGVKPFKCLKCDYRSNRVDNVQFHLKKVHKVEREFMNEFIASEQIEDEELKVVQPAAEELPVREAQFIVTEIETQ